jgi:hypothetical protein
MRTRVRVVLRFAVRILMRIVVGIFVRVLVRFASFDTLHIRIILQPSPNLQRHVHFDGTRVGLLFRDPVFGQHIQNELWLNFQFTCQLVDSNHR